MVNHPNRRRPVVVAAPARQLTPAEVMQEHLDQAKREVEFSRRSLINKMESLKGMLDSAIRSLQKGYAPNSLGELQGSAMQIDVGCGQLYAEQKACAELVSLAEKMSMLPSEETAV